MSNALRIAMLWIAALCLASSPNVARADTKDSTLAGGDAGSPVRDTCPPGSMLTGFGYGGDTEIVFLSGYCHLFKDGQWISSYFGLERFGDRPRELTAGQLFCPENTAVAGMTVGVSAAGGIHDIALRCRSPDNQVYVTTPATQIPGGAAAQQRFIGCGTASLAAGLVGRSDARLKALGLVCQPMAPAPAPAPQPAPASKEPPPLEPIPAQPLPSSKGDLSRPPLGIDNSLFAGGGRATTRTVGGGDGDEFTASCGQGYALVGWGYNATSVLTAIVPVCQRVVDGQLLGRHGDVASSALGVEAAGAASGPPIFCPDDEAVRGLSVSLTSDLRVHHIRGTCYAPAGGQAPTLIRPTLTDGGTAPAQRGVSCSPTYAIGLTGTFSPSRGGAITSLGLVCNDPNAAPANAGGQPQNPN